MDDFVASNENDLVCKYKKLSLFNELQLKVYHKSKTEKIVIDFG